VTVLKTFIVIPYEEEFMLNQLTLIFLLFIKKKKYVLANIPLEFTYFRLQVIRQIFHKYGTQRDPRRGRPFADKPLRLTARRFPSLTGGGSRRCIVCSTTVTVKRPKKRSQITYEK
jgi:hypothetical protein